MKKPMYVSNGIRDLAQIRKAFDKVYHTPTIHEFAGLKMLYEDVGKFTTIDMIESGDKEFPKIVSTMYEMGLCYQALIEWLNQTK